MSDDRQHHDPATPDSATITRRRLIAGGAGAAALGASAAVLSTREPSAAPTAAPTSPPQQQYHASVQQAEPTQAPAQDVSLPQGTALVTSPRLPLAGIGASQVGALLQGGIANWRDVGAPIGLPVRTIALDGVVPDGMTPAETVPDYATLLGALAKNPGAVAAVPLEQIDFQVNTLKIDGVDPLHGTGTDQEPIVRVGFAGDIIPGRNVGNYIRRYGDYTYPMLAVKDVLADFDATFANFECFISETIEPPELTDGNTLDFVTRPEFIPALQLAGIDAVSMANNHAVYSSAGWGLPAFNDTIGFFEAAGMPYFGAGRDLEQARAPFVMEANGLTIAVIGIDGITGNLDFPNEADVVSGANSQATADRGGTNPLHMETITSDISRLASEYDIVIPFFHMGNQYVWISGQWAYDTAHKAIDAGASCVISSHPHTIQGMEIYKDKPIFYAIGNFIYDQMFSVDSRQGYVLELTFRGSQIVGFRTHGVEIEAFSQPRFMSRGEQAALMDRFWTSTDMRAAGS